MNVRVAASAAGLLVLLVAILYWMRDTPSDDGTGDGGEVRASGDTALSQPGAEKADLVPAAQPSTEDVKSSSTGDGAPGAEPPPAAFPPFEDVPRTPDAVPTPSGVWDGLLVQLGWPAESAEAKALVQLVGSRLDTRENFEHRFGPDPEERVEAAEEWNADLAADARRLIDLVGREYVASVLKVAPFERIDPESGELVAIPAEELEEFLAESR